MIFNYKKSKPSITISALIKESMPLFGKGARASPPNSQTGLERAAEIEPRNTQTHLYTTLPSRPRYPRFLCHLQSNVIFVCHRTVSMVAVYQQKIKYDQDKFRAVQRLCLPLEDKHVVNENRVIRKSHDATQKKMSSRGTFQYTM